MAKMKIKLTTPLATGGGNLPAGSIIERDEAEGRKVINAGFGTEYTGDDLPLVERAAKPANAEKAEKPAAKKTEKRG